MITLVVDKIAKTLRNIGNMIMSNCTILAAECTSGMTNVSIAMANTALARDIRSALISEAIMTIASGNTNMGSDVMRMKVDVNGKAMKKFGRQ